MADISNNKPKVDKAATGPDDYPGRIWDYLIGKGLGSVTTAAIMGNIWQESKYSPTACENGDVGGYGICQWTDPHRGEGRRTNLETFAAQKGKPVSDLDVQLDYLWNEIQIGYGSVISHMQQYPDDLAKQTEIWCREFEAPDMEYANLQGRINAAQEAYDKQGKGIKVENTYDASSAYSSGGAKSSDGGFRYIEHGKTVTIIKLPDNKTFCEPIYPDFITVSDTVPQWVLDMSYQQKAEETTNTNEEDINKKEKK